MIRYHRAFFNSNQGWLVSTRRKPRGWVVQAAAHEHQVFAPSRYEAYTIDRKVTGWRPVGFNGFKESYIFATKRQAADYLISCHRYHEVENG